MCATDSETATPTAQLPVWNDCLPVGLLSSHVMWRRLYQFLVHLDFLRMWNCSLGVFNYFFPHVVRGLFQLGVGGASQLLVECQIPRFHDTMGVSHDAVCQDRCEINKRPF